MTRSASARTAGFLAVGILMATALAGCAPDPVSSPSSSASAPASSTASPTTAPPSPSASIGALPASCATLTSPAMSATLQQSVGPLNDPGMQLYSTQIAAALEVLNGGIPTLRCTWGGPSGTGLSTNASLVDAGQASRVQAALEAAGLSCSPLGAGALCAASSKTVDLNDRMVTRGESHYLGGGLWVATSWVGSLPDGYTQDIVDTLGH